LHVDTGREMQGGQWQVLYLTERLRDATLAARKGSALASMAVQRGVAMGGGGADLVHAHGARAHSLGVLKSGKPLVVSRRVGFPVKTSFLSRQKYQRAAMFIAVSRFVADRLREAGVAEERIRVVYDGVPVPAAESTRESGRVIALPSKWIDIAGVKIHAVADL